MTENENFGTFDNEQMICKTNKTRTFCYQVFDIHP